MIVVDPDDPYLDRSTGVLVNLLGIRDQGQLEAAEHDLVLIRDAELVKTPIPGRYDERHLCDIHRALFQDVYPWAGALRTVNIDKGLPFALAPHLTAGIAQLHDKIQILGPLKDMARTDVVSHVAEIYADLNALHPFREGNGRTQRAFIRQLVAQAGWQLTWADVNPADNAYASQQSMIGDNGPLIEMLDVAVQRMDELGP